MLEQRGILQAPKLVLWDWQDTLHNGAYFLPFAIDLINYFYKFDIKQAVITNAQAAKIIPLLDKEKLLQKIELVVGADMGLPIKPYPDMILYALKHYKIDKKDAILFGDSDNDMIAAKKADVNFYSVWNGLENIWSFYNNIDVK